MNDRKVSMATYEDSNRYLCYEALKFYHEHFPYEAVYLSVKQTYNKDTDEIGWALIYNDGEECYAFGDDKYDPDTEEVADFETFLMYKERAAAFEAQENNIICYDEESEP
jgi:hypothetical protein